MAKTANKVKLENTGERMVPEFSVGTLMYAEHIVRYQAALPFVEKKTVLDIACGSGYGANMLASKAKMVYGVDIDTATVTYANEQYGDKNIEFISGEATKIPLDDNSVDVVITFETIEHVKNYKLFLSEIDRILKKDGLLLISTPNSLEFTKGNHFHLHEFQYKELIDVVKPHFEYIESYFQGTWKTTAIGNLDFISKISQKNVDTGNYAPLKGEDYLYFYLVCSRKPISISLSPVAGIGEHYSDKETSQAWADSNAHNERLHDEAQNHIQALDNQIIELKKELTDLYSSKTYKLSRVLSNTKRKVTNR